MLGSGEDKGGGGMLRLRLLGGFVLAGDRPQTLSNKKAQALIAYLALENDKPHSRESIAGLLWADKAEEAARQSLRQCVSVVRRDFPELPLSADQEVVSLDANALVIDVTEF